MTLLSGTIASNHWLGTLLDFNNDYVQQNNKKHSPLTTLKWSRAASEEIEDRQSQTPFKLLPSFINLSIHTMQALILQVLFDSFEKDEY